MFGGWLLRCTRRFHETGSESSMCGKDVRKSVELICWAHCKLCKQAASGSTQEVWRGKSKNSKSRFIWKERKSWERKKVNLEDDDAMCYVSSSIQPTMDT